MNYISHSKFSEGDHIRAISQVLRYGVVGILNNLLGYLIYLGLTWSWLDPILAVSILYPIGALTAYFGHAKYTFAYDGHVVKGSLRYVLAHIIGYSVNISLIYVFSDRLLYSHQIVQAVAIFVLAVVLFLLFVINIG